MKACPTISVNAIEEKKSGRDVMFDRKMEVPQKRCFPER
jgi:hypothetical protein